MKHFLMMSLFVGWLAVDIGSPVQSYGETFQPVGFDEMVARSVVILRGRVLRLESVWNKGVRPPVQVVQEKAAQPPPIEPRDVMRAEESSALLPSEEVLAPAPPQGIPAEGGRMIFTRVTLETIESIKGSVGQDVEFFIVGGTLDGLTATVSGMPRFEVGETYMLFLRNGYLQSADPIVGVNQGFFRVVQHPDLGFPVLLNAAGDYVSGIEDNQIVVQHNAHATVGQRQALRLAGPPTPDHPGVQSQMSPEVQRYWNSPLPPMRVSEFVSTARSHLSH